MTLKAFYVVTPKCQPQYAWLVEPDTAFNKRPEWKVDLILDSNDSKTASVAQQIEDGFEAYKKALKEANPKKTFKLADSTRYEFTTHNGAKVFKIKTRRYVSGTDMNGKPYNNTPPLLMDKYKTPITGEEREKYRGLGEGTIIQVRLRCAGYDHPAHGVGLTIQPDLIVFHNFVPYRKTQDEEATSLDGFEFESEEKDLAPSNLDNSAGGNTF